MNEEKARQILRGVIEDDNSLHDADNYTVKWSPEGYDYEEINLDGVFEVEYLKALVWWMENKSEPL